MCNLLFFPKICQSKQEIDAILFKNIIIAKNNIWKSDKIGRLASISNITDGGVQPSFTWPTQSNVSVKTAEHVVIAY